MLLAYKVHAIRADTELAALLGAHANEQWNTCSLHSHRRKGADIANEVMCEALAAELEAQQAAQAEGGKRSKPHELRRLRIAKRESQEKFWSRFGVTQSSGSRFETGLELPPPVAILLRLYVNGRVSDGDLQV